MLKIVSIWLFAIVATSFSQTASAQENGNQTGQATPAAATSSISDVAQPAPARLPNFRLARSIKGLSVEQKQGIDTIESETNISIQAIREHLAILSRRMSVSRAHPDEMVIVQYEAVPSLNQVSREIADLNREIDRKKRLAEARLFGLLTESQIKQFEGMSHSESNSAGASERPMTKSNPAETPAKVGTTGSDQAAGKLEVPKVTSGSRDK